MRKNSGLLMVVAALLIVTFATLFTLNSHGRHTLKTTLMRPFMNQSEKLHASHDSQTTARENAFWRGFNQKQFNDAGDNFEGLGSAFKLYLRHDVPEAREMSFHLLVSSTGALFNTKKQEALADKIFAEGGTPKQRHDVLADALASQLAANAFYIHVFSDKERLALALKGEPVPLLPEPSE